MNTARTTSMTRRVTAAGLVAVFLFCLIALPASASVNALRNAFNPRGFFVTLKSTDQPEWLRSSFVTGVYGSGGGQGGGSGGGGGGGQGANAEKDDLGHSNVQYVGEEAGLDYIDAADVDTIYSTYDHNPKPGKDFMVGYYKDSQTAPLQAIPDFSSCIGTPNSGTTIATDPVGGQGWKTPIHLNLGEEQENGSHNALAFGTLYEFAYLRGNQANNGTTCVLMPGETDGTYKGYISFKGDVSEKEQAEYEARKYDEYEFITAIYPEGTSSDTSIDHTIESVPMRYHIQTYADLRPWYEADGYKEAEAFLASVSEADYASGKYVRENVDALRIAKASLDQEAEEDVKRQLQKDAEWTIQQMLEDLKEALETAKQPKEVVNFTDYNASLASAEATYNELKDKTGTAVDQYRPEPVEALRQAIDHAKSTINDSSKQAEVDAEKTALDNARMNALDALIRPEERIFTDTSTGIIVTAPTSSLPDAARLVVREVVAGTTEYDEMVARVSPKPDRVAIYRILFYDGIDVVHPTQPVTVQIPLLDSLEQTAPNVYYLDNAGSPAQRLNASAPQGYRIFETGNLGTFVVGGVLQNQQNDQTPQQLTPQSVTPQNQNQPQGQNQTPQQNQNNNPVHTTTRTTTRSVRTTRVIRTTRNANDQNKQNEMTTTSVLQTQAVQPTTMTTTSPAPTSAQDTSGLEQEQNQHTLLYIALAVAAIGIGAAAYEFYKDKKNGAFGTDNDDEV